jgi:deoxyribodipyrimidine photo-lyase
MEKEKVEVLWFRNNLRIGDNPFFEKKGYNILPIFIFNKEKNNLRANFIFNTILSLKKNLKNMELDLALFCGKPQNIFDYIAEKFEIIKIYTSFDNNFPKEEEKNLKENYNLEIIYDSFFIKPEKIFSKEGKPYKVFSHFKEKAFKFLDDYPLIEYKFDKKLKLANFEFEKIISLKENKVEKLPFSLESLGYKREEIKFKGALFLPEELLKRFEGIIKKYEAERDFPYLNSTSLLCVHLRFGTISIRDVLRWALKQKGGRKFLEELVWREFFNYLFFHFPEMEKNGLRKLKINWKEDKKYLEKWKRGEIGVPLVDAGMRQLLVEGFIHNRVRMVVADYLVKNLKINWKLGEEYFSEKLLDYEKTSNIGNWQWVIGIGADPKFLVRKFNPFLQSKKFDPNCFYIKKYLPELKNANPSKIHKGEIL